jgi:hypothetical protein
MNIVSYLYEKTKNYHSMIIGVLLLAFFAWVGYYAYNRYFINEKQMKKPFNDVANAPNQQPIAKIYYFFVDWCPYCQKTKDDWNLFKSSVSGTMVNGYLVECISVNCTEDSGENQNKDYLEGGQTPQDITTLINQFQINAYPTVKMIKDDETIDYDAQINYDNLNKFANTVL